MAEFSCAAAGAESCGWKTSGDDEEAVVAEAAQHLQDEHGVQVMSRTLTKYARAVARGENVAPPLTPVGASGAAPVRPRAARG